MIKYRNASEFRSQIKTKTHFDNGFHSGQLLHLEHLPHQFYPTLALAHHAFEEGFSQMLGFHQQYQNPLILTVDQIGDFRLIVVSLVFDACIRFDLSPLTDFFLQDYSLATLKFVFLQFVFYPVGFLSLSLVAIFCYLLILARDFVCSL